MHPERRRLTKRGIAGSLLEALVRMPACKHVLVIDDNIDFLTTIKDTLELMYSGASIEVADQVRAAEQLLAAGPTPDVIVVDLKLNGASGRDFIARAKSDPRLAGVPLIAMSGAIPAIREMVARHEVEAGLEKPFSVEDFIEALERACAARQGHGAMPPAPAGLD